MPPGFGLRVETRWNKVDDCHRAENPQAYYGRKGKGHTDYPTVAQTKSEVLDPAWTRAAASTALIRPCTDRYR